MRKINHKTKHLLIKLLFIFFCLLMILSISSIHQEDLRLKADDSYTSFDFEDNITEWTFNSLSGYDNSQVVLDNTVYHKGTKSLKIVKNSLLNASSEYDPTLYTNSPISVIGGGLYEFYAWVKSSNCTPGTTISFDLAYTLQSNDVVYGVPHVLNGSQTISEWEMIYTRSYIKEGVTQVYPQFVITAGETTVWIDDIGIRKIEDVELDNTAHFEMDSDGQYNGWSKVGTVYSKKITQLSEGNCYHISGGVTDNTATAILRFYDVFGKEIDGSISKTVNNTFEFSFRTPSCVYAILELSSKPSAYELTRIYDKNILTNGGYWNSKNYATLSTKNSLYGYAFNISKEDGTGYFYYDGKTDNNLVLSAGRTYDFSFDVKVENASSDLEFSTYKAQTNCDWVDFFSGTEQIIRQTHQGEWIHISSSYQCDTTGAADIGFRVYSGSADIFIENIVMTETVDLYALNVENLVVQTSNKIDLNDTESYRTETLTASVEGSKIIINGETFSPIIYLESYNSGLINDGSKGAAESNIELYSTYGGDLKKLWKEDGSVDFDSFDQSIYGILNADSNAYIMVNISMEAPTWWLEANPNEEEIAYTSEDNFVRTGGVSFASEKFRNDAGIVLKNIIQHMQTQDYYNSVFAIKLSAGITLEWTLYGMGTIQGDSYSDYSKCSITGFKEYLQETYETISALNLAWGTSLSSFDEITLPTYTERNTSGSGYFYSADQRKIIDYNLYLGVAIADTFLYYADIVKIQTNDTRIVGGYFGYLWNVDGFNGIGTIHTSMVKLLESTKVDFFSSPINYSERLLGQASAYMSMNDSIRAYGKLYIIEQDNRTSFTKEYGNGWYGNEANDVGQTYTVEDSIFALKNDMIRNMIDGAGYWHFDMNGGWFDNDQMRLMTNVLIGEYDYSLRTLQNSDFVNEVAVFVDDEMYAYTNSSASHANSFYTALFNMQRKNLAAMGAGYDLYAMSTLEAGKVPAHKVNIILSAFELTNEERSAINTYLKKDGQYVVFVGPVGYINGTSYNVDNISSLTGLTIEETSATKVMHISVTNSDMGNIRYGVKGAAGFSPVVYVNDNSAITWGSFVENGVDGSLKGLVYKNMDTWNCVFSSAPNLPASVLKYVLKQAGVHVYSESEADIIYSNNGYIALHSMTGETKTLLLPETYTVYDVLSKKIVARNVTQFTYSHEKYDTKLFRLIDESSVGDIAITVNGGEGSGVYTICEEVTLSASERDGYNFKGFEVDGKIISTESTYTFIALGSITVTAVYEPIVHYVTFVAENVQVAKLPYTLETEAIEEPSIPNKEGYDGVWGRYSLVAGGDITVNAIYIARAPNYIDSFGFAGQSVATYADHTITVIDNKGDFWFYNGGDAFNAASEYVLSMTVNKTVGDGIYIAYIGNWAKHTNWSNESNLNITFKGSEALVDGTNFRIGFQIANANVTLTISDIKVEEIIMEDDNINYIDSFGFTGGGIATYADGMITVDDSIGVFWFYNDSILDENTTYTISVEIFVESYREGFTLGIYVGEWKNVVWTQNSGVVTFEFNGRDALIDSAYRIGFQIANGQGTVTISNITLK